MLFHNELHIENGGCVYYSIDSMSFVLIGLPLTQLTLSVVVQRLPNLLHTLLRGMWCISDDGWRGCAWDAERDCSQDAGNLRTLYIVGVWPDGRRVMYSANH